MTARADATQRTREALIDAGLTVAEEHGLAGLSINRVVAEAGLGKGTFYVHFPDRVAFVVALHRAFHDRIEAAVEAAARDREPGHERLRRTTEVYLDACLHARGVRAFLFESRAEPAVVDDSAARTDRFAEQATPDLEAMGWRQPAKAARLLVSMAAELALQEVRRGGQDSQGRRVLWRLLEQADLTAG